jgi:hypothetical protein
VKRNLFRLLTGPIAFLLAGLLWLAPLLRDPGGFPFWAGGGYSDLAISHYPVALLVHRALETWGQLPLWNPLILSGGPLVGDPLAGIWYPPNWLIVAFPTAAAFNVLFWAHLGLAGWGAARLARSQGVEVPGSLLAGLVFGGAPKLIGHIGLGHPGLVFAVAWTPWLLLAVNQAALAVRRGVAGGAKWAALAGAVLAVIFLADPRWLLPTGILGLAYGIRRAAHSHTGVNGTRALVAVGTAAVLCAMTAAVLALPMVQLVSLSARASISPEESARLALPAARLLGVLVPDLGGWPEWLTYGGIVAFCLACAALLGRRDGALFWGAVMLGAWLLALGSQTPVYETLVRVVPGAGMLRVPPRFLFLASLALAQMAGSGLGLLTQPGRFALLRRARLGALAVAVCAVLLGIGLDIMRGATAGSYAFLVVAGLAAALSLLRPSENGIPSTARGSEELQSHDVGASSTVGVTDRPPRDWGGRLRSESGLAAAWIVLIVADLILVDSSLLEPRASAEVLADRLGLAQRLAADPGSDRIFSPSYSLPQQTAAAVGLELADGVNPLQLAGYVSYMAQAAGFPQTGYSETLPPFPSGDPKEDWGPRLDADALGLLNIGYVVSDYPAETTDLVLERSDDVFVYRNQAARPRAWIEPAPGGSSVAWLPVESLSWTPNRIEIGARGPGQLVLSEISYPGWQAMVDGERAQLLTPYGILRGVAISEGEHQVIFRFVPWPFYGGVVLSLAGALLLAWMWVRR